jgi:indolepyruvate ferredoxin oxidoreductase alpha subunit
MKKFLMGNEAIALGAMHAGVHLACGYPGTPSTEILETLAKENDGGIYVEWSVNEKAALEVAAGAAYAGARTLVTMKQVGLNVASDPLMSLAYVGVKGGMVIVVADDPGPISSQTEQDTRHFARFSKLPVFDPSSPEEAYQMVRDAFDLSEKYETPVFLRPTTRVCHGCTSMALGEPLPRRQIDGFVKDPKWVIFPALSYRNHLKLEERNPRLGEEFSAYRFNTVTGKKALGRKGVAAGGISYTYTREALGDTEIRLFKVATPHPFPEKLAMEFLDGLDEVMVLEELDPVIERELIYICGKHHLNVKIRGKLTGDVQQAGENSVESVKTVLSKFIGTPAPSETAAPGAPGSLPPQPPLPVRPPVLCAGCPHRGSFYAVKQAMKNQKAIYAGDIGCYTLGNAQPLDMVDTCLCMGADITMAQGLQRASAMSGDPLQPGVKCFAFIGDSTFFASGLTGVVNAVYNGSDITLVVLDNSTTAMTGQQEHPGTGKTLMGAPAPKISIPAVLKALGVGEVVTADPFRLDEAVAAVIKAADYQGVSAVVFESPCIAVRKPDPVYTVDEATCIGCKKCIRELGCPAISIKDKKAEIEPTLCYGCALCAQVCPTKAIGGTGK